MLSVMLNVKDIYHHYLIFLLFKPEKKHLRDTTKTPDNMAVSFVVVP